MAETVDDGVCAVADKIPRMEEPVPSIGVHTFHERIMENECFFQVIKLEDSFHLWIGNSPAKFGTLSVAMQTKCAKLPSSVSLLGGSDSPSVAIASRLAKRTGKQAFVSCNVLYHGQLFPLIEKRIGEELKNHPEKF